jgi:hypothetical protein
MVSVIIHLVKAFFLNYHRHADNDPSIEGLRAQYLQKGFATDWFPRSTSWITVFHNVLGAKALPHILDGSLDHMVDADEDSEDIDWTYEVDLEEGTLTTINSDDEEIGHRKFEDLTIEYMRDLELADETRRKHQPVVDAEVDDGRAVLQTLLILTVMQSLRSRADIS